MSAKKTFWATVGRVLWFVISLVLRVVARLGSRWAQRKLDDHDGNRRRRVFRRRSR